MHGLRDGTCVRKEAARAVGRRSGLLDPVVQAARDELQNVGLPADRILVLRAIWRDLLIGFTQQLGEHGLAFNQLAVLYATAGTESLSVGELAGILGRSPSATSRAVSDLARRGLVTVTEEVADRRVRLVTPTAAGTALLGTFDRSRADQFLSVVRPLPHGDRRWSRWAWLRSPPARCRGAVASSRPTRAADAKRTTRRSVRPWPCGPIDGRVARRQAAARIVADSPLTCRKSASNVSRCPSTTRAVAAIQMSFAWIGVPATAHDAYTVRIVRRPSGSCPRR